MCRKRFADMMGFMVQEPGLEPEHLFQRVSLGRPWGSYRGRSIGGSHGAISCALAGKYPLLKPVVQVRDYLPGQGRAM